MKDVCDDKCKKRKEALKRVEDVAKIKRSTLFGCGFILFISFLVFIFVLAVIGIKIYFKS